MWLVRFIMLLMDHSRKPRLLKDQLALFDDAGARLLVRRLVASTRA